MRRAAWARAGGVVVAVVGVVLALTSCSSSSKTPPSASRATTPAGSSPTAQPAGAPRFTIGEPDVAAYNTPPALPVEVKTAAQALLDQYLARAVVTALQSGRAGDLTPLFTAAALARVSGPDRSAMVDEGISAVTDVAVGKATAQLTALLGPDGAHVVVAGINLIVTGKVNGAPIVVQRSGELSLVVDGDAWKISSYDVHVDRDVPQ